MKNRLLLLTFALCGVLCQCLSAQERWLRRYESFNRKFPQERVWMHFDNQSYFLGDTLWYACYLQSDQQFLQNMSDEALNAPLSRVLYVELRSPEGLFIKRNIHYVQENGTCQGYIAMSDSLYAGFYEVRAYTAWMLNFRDDLKAAKEDKQNPWQNWWKKQVPVRDYTEYDYIDTEGLTGEPGHQLIVGQLYEVQDGNGFQMRVKSFTPKNGEEAGLLSIDNQYDALQTTPQDIQHSFLYASNPRIFSRVLPIYTRIEGRPELRMMKLRQKMHTGTGIQVDDHPTVDFYPEGGHWVRNTRSRLCIEMRDGRGQHISPQRLCIVHKDGTRTQAANRLHRGCNLFVTDNDFWRHYSTESKLSFDLRGKSYTFDLPTPDEIGVGLYCEWQGDSLVPQLTTSGIDPKALRTAVVSRGTEGRKVGVNELIVYDTLANLLASRLFFVYPDLKQTVTYNAKHHKIHTVPGAQLSVSVTDARDRNLNYGAGNLLTGMLLNSEVKGFIEDPDYYFIDNSPARREQLDLLLLVQGWRRYEWTSMISPLGSHFRPYYRNEQKLEINGQILPLLGKKLKRPLQLNCQIVYDTKHVFDAVYNVDLDGKFSFPVMPVSGDFFMSLRVHKDSADVEKQKYYYTSGNAFRYRIWKERAISPTPKVYSYYESTDRDLVVDDDTLALFRLDEVSVKEKSSHKLDLKQPLVRYSMLDYLDFLNDVSFRYSASDTLDYEDNFTCQFNPYWVRLNFMRTNNVRAQFLRKIHGDVRADSASGDTTIKYLGTYQKNPTRLFIDSLEWDELWKERLFYQADRPIENNSLRYGELSIYADINDRSRFLSDNKIHAIEEVHLMLSSKDRLSISDKALKYEILKLHSYQKPAQFYNAKSADKSAHASDPFRRTFYWNPSLQTNEKGEATIDFLPRPGADYTIHINGIAPDGTLLHFEY